MEPEPSGHDIGRTDGIERPAFVLVRDGVVVARFAPGEAQAAADTAYRLTERDGRHVDVYEVDRRLPPAPDVGRRVDPEALGWSGVG